MKTALVRRLLEFAYDLGRAEDLDELRHAVTTGIRSVVRADLASYTEVNRDTGQVIAPLDPAIDDRGAVEALGQCAEQHPLINRTTGTAQTISDYLTARQFHRLELYHDVYRRLDAEDQIAINLPSPGPLSIGVALNRGRPGFDSSDREVLDVLRPILIKSRRAVLARERSRALGGPPAANSGLVVSSIEGWIEFATPLARSYLQRYFPPTLHDQVPELLREWLLTHGAAPGEQLIRTHGSRRLTITSLSAGHGEPFRLELRESLDRELALSPREQEILALLSAGHTNQGIADTLIISRRTVENHLQSIYRKLGVHNRTAAVAAISSSPIA
jgi:DNA-binding CsgD family transcriptional regulator